MTAVLVWKGEDTQRHAYTHKEENQVIEAEIGVMQQQAKKREELPASNRN